MTIRAKLLAAIVLTVIGPVVTIGVALAAFGTLEGRFDDVVEGSRRQSHALELKFAVTDMNGWQTAYGYDGGRSRPQFEAASEQTKELIGRAEREFTSARERELLGRLGRSFDSFMEIDADAYAALEAGRDDVVRRLFLGPEIRNFEAMAAAADALAREQERQAVAAESEFDDSRSTARRELVAVGIGAGVVIILLLITVQDVVRLALERRAE